MRGLLGILATLAVMGLGYWAYSENYATQDAIRGLNHMERDVADAKARLQILRDEWAYLNRPTRLKDLVELNFEHLQLMPMSPDSFGQFEQVMFPRPVIEFNMMSGAVEVMAEDLPEQGDPL